MDFGALPPEVNSGRMYSGAGPGPLMTAAATWKGLAADLFATASSYRSVIAVLSASWMGPSSIAMAAAAGPYVAWLGATAAQAEATAAQAKAAVAAYEVAFAMTVPPPVIAANRALLVQLIATNIFGQNTPAIAAADAQYAEMWAQDAAAMFGYSGTSAAASTLTPFTSPPRSANPAALVDQAAANVSTDVTTGEETWSQFIHELTTTITTFFFGPNGIALGVNFVGLFLSSGVYANFFMGLVGLVSGPALAAAETAAFTAPAAAAAVSSTDPLTPQAGPNPVRFVSTGPLSGSGAVSANAGRSAKISRLSVPAAWTASPEVRQLAKLLPSFDGVGTPSIVMADVQDSPYIGMALAGLVGGGMGFATRRSPSATSTPTTPAGGDAAPKLAAKPAALIPTMPGAAAKPAAAVPTIPITTPAEGLPGDVAETLAAALAAMPGATVVLIPPSAE
jgi:PPE-repeat protein